MLSRHLAVPPRNSGVINIIISTTILTHKKFFFQQQPRYFVMSHTNSDNIAASNGSTSYKKVLTIDSINPAVVSAKYAVRGELALRANELERLTKSGKPDLPFKDVVHCEIGNPQALDQKPLTFIRQVCSGY